MAQFLFLHLKFLMKNRAQIKGIIICCRSIHEYTRISLLAHCEPATVEWGFSFSVIFYCDLCLLLESILIKFPDLFSYNYILSMEPAMHLNIFSLTSVTPSCVQPSCVFSDYFSVYICKDNLSIWMVFLPCESARGFSAKQKNIHSLAKIK